MDRYTKLVLTLIAIGVWGNLLTNLAGSGGGPIGVAHAQADAPTKVVIVGQTAPLVLRQVDSTKVVIVGVQTTVNDAPLAVVDTFARATAMATSQSSQAGSQSRQPPPPR